MAVAGEGDVLSYTRKWMDQVNRGGLFPLSDNSFHLFISIEKCVRVYLPKHLTEFKSEKKDFQQNVQEKMKMYSFIGHCCHKTSLTLTIHLQHYGTLYIYGLL